MKSDLAGASCVQLSDLDRALLDELRAGARTQAYLIDATGESRYRVHRRLQLLDAAGYIENIHAPTALYEFRHGPDGDA